MTLFNVMLSRRSMLLGGGAALLTGACAPRLSVSTPAVSTPDVQDPYAAIERAPSSSVLFYRPANLDLFDTAVHYYDGTYYLVHRSDTPYSNNLRRNEARRHGMDRIIFSKDQYAPNGTAISQDGVHWKNTGLTDYDGQVWRAGSGEDGKPRFVAHVGKRLSSKARLYTGSPDLKNWKPLSDQYATLADPRWYDPNGRWSEISTVPRPGGGFFGYWGATPKNGPDLAGARACYF